MVTLVPFARLYRAAGPSVPIDGALLPWLLLTMAPAAAPVVGGGESSTAPAPVACPIKVLSAIRTARTQASTTTASAAAAAETAEGEAPAAEGFSGAVAGELAVVVTVPESASAAAAVAAAAAAAAECSFAAMICSILDAPSTARAELSFDDVAARASRRHERNVSLTGLLLLSGDDGDDVRGGGTGTGDADE